VSPSVTGPQRGGARSRAYAPDRLPCRGERDEANIPTEQPQTSQDARLPSSDVDARRKGDLVGAPPPRTPPSVRLRPPATVTSRATFEQLAKNARRGRSGPVAVRFLPGEQEERVLFAYSIGRRYGGAVKRNRCRRRLRAIAAEIAPGLVPGAYLIEVRPGAEQCGFGELRERVFEAIGRAGRSAER
jgi:ribonuclease P protein component